MNAHALTVVVATILGLVVGSFLNVVIWRVPRGDSIVSPPSACPNCGHRLRPYDNIPLVSWMVLRGRCRDCGAHISIRYPAVELSTALLFGLMAGIVPLIVLPAFLWLAAAGVALSAIDIELHRLPNAIVYPSALVVGVWLVGAALLGPHADGVDGPRLALQVALAGLALSAFYLLLVLIYPSGMGLGDAKLALVLGMALGWFSWTYVALGTFLAFLTGALVGIVIMIRGKGGRRTEIPFGPFMFLGTLLTVLAGGPIVDWYASLL